MLCLVFVSLTFAAKNVKAVSEFSAEEKKSEEYMKYMEIIEKIIIFEDGEVTTNAMQEIEIRRNIEELKKQKR